MARTPPRPAPALLPALAAALLLAASCATTPAGVTDPAAIFRGQPPLAASEMGAAFDFFTSKLPRDQAKAEAVKRHRLSPARGEYVITKSAIGLRMLGRDGPDAKAVVQQFGTPMAVPSPDEMRLLQGLRSNIVRFNSAAPR
jgi:hypothetical protein